MPYGLFVPSPRAKRVLRMVRTEPASTRALVEAVGDAVGADELVPRLAEFYRARGVAHELRRRAWPLAAQEWSHLQERLELLGERGLLSGPPVPLTRKEHERLGHRVELLGDVRHLHELADSIRLELTDLWELARLRARDPEPAARATVEAVLDPENLRLDSIAEAALEVCTGPDPSALDVPLAIGVPHVYETGFELIGLQDGCGCAELALVNIDDDLAQLERGCGELRARVWPGEEDLLTEEFASFIARLGQVAGTLHRTRDAGLLILRILDIWL